MDDLIYALFGRPRDSVTDRDLLCHLLKEIRTMAIDVSALTSAVAKLTTDVTALINADVGAAQAAAAATVAATQADQALVDPLVATVNALDAQVTAALQPAPAPTTPAA